MPSTAWGAWDTLTNKTKTPALVKLPSTWRRQTRNNSMINTKYIECAKVIKSCGKKENVGQSKGDGGLEVAPAVGCGFSRHGSLVLQGPAEAWGLPWPLGPPRPLGPPHTLSAVPSLVLGSRYSFVLQLVSHLIFRWPGIDCSCMFANPEQKWGIEYNCYQFLTVT